MLRFEDLGCTASDLMKVAHFYDALFVPEFPDEDERESRANIERYLALREQGWYGANNYHVLLAYEGDDLVGGAICDYFAQPSAGMIEFLVVAPARRGAGFGRALLREVERVLQLDARRANHASLRYVMAEMNDPFATPLASDNVDPFVRALLWGRWGFGALGFPYVQPALSASQSPVTNLLLIAKTTSTSPAPSLPAADVLSAVHEYMRWAMRIDEPAANPQFQSMGRFLHERTEVALTPLGAYVGRDPNRPLEIRAIADAHEADFSAVMALYRRTFQGPVAVGEQDFVAALTASDSESRYHLWAVRRGSAGPVEGFASFFSLPTCGFGGYLALAGSLRASERLALLAARIEENMIRDFPDARGWYIEVAESRLVDYFRRYGFRELRVRYVQPTATRTPLHLMYKKFGRAFGAAQLERTALLAALADILRHVYGIAEPQSHPTYASIEAGLASDDVGFVDEPAT